ncbi:MAG: fibrillarin-like rRNA/tRNA 2'-O-methyltransferase [Promethearchaeota archaeon]
MSGKIATSVQMNNRYWNVYNARMVESDILCTKNLVPGKTVYSEKLIFDSNSIEFREWDPRRSKLCAYLKKGGTQYHFSKDISILYLGSSSGTTVSHVSDIIEGGRIYSVEFSARSMRELIQRLDDRQNVIPILADATQPSQYRSLIPEQVDIIYQDVAQPNQAKLLFDNIKIYLKPGGIFYIAVKARSIDVSQDPAIIFRQERDYLEKKGCKIFEMKDISPFSEDHVMIVGKWAPRNG